MRSTVIADMISSNLLIENLFKKKSHLHHPISLALDMDIITQQEIMKK